MKYLFIVLLLIAGLTACQQQESKKQTAPPVTATQDPDKIIAIGKIEPELDILELAAPTGGIVHRVYRRNGDSVQKDEIILSLDDEVEQLKLKEIRASMETQRSRIELERKGLRETSLNLSNKKALLEKTKRLVDKGYETRQTYDDLVTEVEVLEANLEKGKTGVVLEERQLNVLVSELRSAENELARKQFRAPAKGILLENKADLGESVSQYASYASFAPAGPLIVRAEVDELFASKLALGQQADITTIGNDKLITKGKLISISPFLKKKSMFSEKTDDQEDRRVREIKVAIDQAENLIINTKVECNIKTRS